MGYSEYSTSNRSVRAETKGYKTKNADEIFEQNRKREAHYTMDLRNAKIKTRESRDSDTHPNSVPIILVLDVTGSMGAVPEHLIREGLPHLMGQIIQNGVPDPQILFLAIGDHECDKFPIQVGQFESGDEELDMWLERTYLEKNGGGNNGESYHLSWYYASRYIVTDAWEKRKQKGILITIGDEPCLPNLPGQALNKFLGEPTESNYTRENLLKDALEKWDVYHIHVEHSIFRELNPMWISMLGKNVRTAQGFKNVAPIVVDIVTSTRRSATTLKKEKKEEKIVL